MNFPDRGDVDALIDPQPLPDFARVQYEPETAAVDDPSAAARTELDRLDFDGLEAGATVAVAVGSRGIHRIDDIVETVVADIRDRGFEPVVVPAMGSHGGATPEGQREVLESLGITESRLDAPIDARMDTAQVDTVTVGDTEFPVHVSTAAQEADAVVVVNRVKPHTNYSGRIESGLTKMTVVGLGKQHGAKAFHSTAIKEGYVETLEAALPVVESALPLVGGVALVENFHEETAHVEAIPAGSFTDREPALLEQAYDEMATLPVDDIDLLVVDELGKDVSGAGMDTNVIGRYRVLNAPDPDEPSIKLLYARGLTEMRRTPTNRRSSCCTPAGSPRRRRATATASGWPTSPDRLPSTSWTCRRRTRMHSPAGRRRRRSSPSLRRTTSLLSGRRCPRSAATILTLSASSGYRPHRTSRRSTSPSRLSMSCQPPPKSPISSRLRLATGQRRLPGSDPSVSAAPSCR